MKYNYIFNPCTWSEIHPLVESHIIQNSITVESFWEDHVFDSNHYKIACDGETAGFFAIHGSSTITLFHILERYARDAQELFAQIKKYEQVTNALVPTGDEFFISHCVDDFARLEKQAYFSTYTGNEIPSERRLDVTLRLADVDKDTETLMLAGDFLKEEIELVKNGLDVLKLYIAELDGETVGFGVIQYGRVVTGIASIGMYVCEPYRRRGIAANILQSLKHISLENGCRVFSGCWYYNHNSKKSMESAGAYSKTRLLRFYF